MALNAPIQGSAADLIKVAMLGVDRELTRRGLGSRMLLQVHDELVLEVAPGERDEVEALVREQMGAAGGRGHRRSARRAARRHGRRGGLLARRRALTRRRPIAANRVAYRRVRRKYRVRCGVICATVSAHTAATEPLTSPPGRR